MMDKGREVEFTVDLNIGGSAETVSVVACLFGRHRPSTWGYSGGDPEEWPDVWLVSVSRLDGTEVSLDRLSDEDVIRLERLALERDNDERYMRN